MALQPYAALEARFARWSDLGGAAAVLNWDRAVMMPPGGAAARAEQEATLAGLAHETLTHWSVGGQLAAAEARAGALDPWQRANLAEMRRLWEHATAVPTELVAALSRAASRCEHAWRGARAAGDFAAVRPLLQEVLDLTREVARNKAARLGLGRYDALMDGFDPGARRAWIDPLFEDLAAFLPGFLERVRSRDAVEEPLPGPFAVAAQERLGRQVLEQLGFDFSRGRLDVSTHPFTGGVPDDVRLTSRYDEADFLTGLLAIIHEAGHGLYEANLPAAWRRQPVGRALGMSVHESQSLGLEMQAARTDWFLSWLGPAAAAAFGADPADPRWSAARLAARVRRVRPGFIRVDADEVTYPLHILLRYRLEQDLVAGRLDLADLPRAWSDGLEGLLGIRPPDDRLGCLQDIHWYDGAWGYFPSYTLGALMAAQLMEAALAELPEIPTALSQGDFRPLTGWMREKVHSQGRRLDAASLIRAATGRPLDAEAFKRHLARRYLGEA